MGYNKHDLYWTTISLSASLISISPTIKATISKHVDKLYVQPSEDLRRISLIFQIMNVLIIQHFPCHPISLRKRICSIYPTFVLNL